MKRILSGLMLLLLIAAETADQKKAIEQLDQAVKAAKALNDCQVKFRLYTSAGKNQELHLYTVEEGKYLHNPVIYYQKRIQVEANYKEQAADGYQGIYRGDQDILELLLPSGFRTIGVLRVFPEDPKAIWMNGGRLKAMAPWDLMDGFAKQARISRVSSLNATLAGKQYLLFQITQNQGTYYVAGINRVNLFVNPQTLLPFRFEQFRPGEDKPCAWCEYEWIKVNTGLKPDDIDFEGFKNPISMFKGSQVKDVDPLLGPIQRAKLPEPAPQTQAIIAEFNKAVDGILSYRADLSMRFRYKRLRLYREDRFAYHKDPYWFTLATTNQKANYILLNHSAGSTLWFDPDDKTFHILGGGGQKMLGEVVFTSSDYKFYSPLGDNPYEDDFAHIQGLLKDYFAGGKLAAWTVNYKNKKMYELEVRRAGEVWPRHPGSMNLVIDPANNLPCVVEFSDYDDPKAFMAMTVDNLMINVKIKPKTPNF
jgi:hypothetical protein